MSFVFGEKPTVSIDFDGTLVENDYPFIGKWKNDALTLLKELKLAGWNILINTCRTGKYENDVRNFLKRYCIEIDGINKNLSGYEKFGYKDSRKLGCDYIIDDKCVFYKDNLMLILKKLLSIYDQRRDI
jgi:hypothetical protein